MPEYLVECIISFTVDAHDKKHALDVAGVRLRDLSPVRLNDFDEINVEEV